MTEWPAGEGLNWLRLEQYLRQHLSEVDGAFDVSQFSGGKANLTYQVSFGERRYVVRRPPFGTLPPGAHDMSREYRALSGLWQSYDRAARTYLLCEDPDILGATFFVMDYRAGVGVWDKVPPELQVGADVGRRLGFAVVDALADLHRVDPVSCGLENLGRPDGFVSRQVSGWAKRWSLVAQEDSTAMNAAAELLERTQPHSDLAVILHNDLKPDNCQFQVGKPDRVYSIFDWDMATLGDPLIDLGTLLNYWPDLSDTPTDRSAYLDGLEIIGLPSRREVVERYADRTGIDTSAIAWYEAFACWKSAVVTRQLEARYLAGQSDNSLATTQARQIPAWAERTLRLLRG
jgi:aminoglycoside phosphotransferase (APT) family kinase protein